MELIYGIKDRPSLDKVFLFALQQLLAIMAATIAVPAIVGNGLSASAALFGAGVGTAIYLFFTKSSSPVFLGSSFAFIGSMFSAFSGAASLAIGYWGLIIGSVMAAIVYIFISQIVKIFGVAWIDRLMPPVIIGPTVAVIGLSLSGSAITDLTTSNIEGGNSFVALICGLITLFVTIYYSRYGKKIGKLIPFILGILSGYLVALIFAIIGHATDNPSLVIINYSALTKLDFTKLSSYFSVPKFTIAMGGMEGLKGVTGTYLLTIFTAYVPVAFVVFAEHIADHKNLSSIVGVNLLENPGLSRTLFGDGIGVIASTVAGGCPCTTYGESIGCVAITRNASTISIWGCALLCVIFSFFTPLVAFLETIPSCVMGGVCITLYGFISVSGLKMFQKVDLNENSNLFVASVILITGVGGMVIKIGKVEIRTVACALIMGIITNIFLSRNKEKTEKENTENSSEK